MKKLIVNSGLSSEIILQDKEKDQYIRYAFKKGIKF